jgi:hypothetical protein
VTEDRFADRLDAATYENDDGVVGVFEETAADPDALWLSEQLFHRLTTVASAYQLHTLPMLGGLEPMQLNRLRCESLLDELAFVAERLNDPLATATAQAISDYVVVRTRRPAWEGSITIEGD